MCSRQIRDGLVPIPSACYCVLACVPRTVHLCVQRRVGMFVFGPCHNVEAKGLEPYHNLQEGEEEKDREMERERDPEGTGNQETWQLLGSHL